MNTDKTNQPKIKKPAKHTESQETRLLSDILPLPVPRFRGRIGNTYVDSKADIISLPTAPAGAPNVLAILLDDVGFGQTSTFGGPVQTPTLQRLADEGLRISRVKVQRRGSYAIRGTPAEGAVFKSIDASILVPLIGAELIRTVPPTNLIRSRMLASPMPFPDWCSGTKPTPSSTTRNTSRPLSSFSPIETWRALLCFSMLCRAS